MRLAHKKALRAGCPPVKKGYFWEPRSDGGFSLFLDVSNAPGSVKVRWIGERSSNGDWHGTGDCSIPVSKKGLTNDENKKTTVAQPGGRAERDNRGRSGDSLGDTGSGIEPAGMVARPAETEVSNEEIYATDIRAAVRDGGDSGGRGDGERVPEPQSAGTGHAAGASVGDSEPVSKSPTRSARRAKPTGSPVSNVVYDSRLLTGERMKKTKELAALLTGEQFDVKSILPPLTKGFWWDAPADDKGFKIKLRWRDEQRKQKTYVFRRLGKHELQTLREQPYADQKADLADRLAGELILAGRHDLASRLTAHLEDHQETGGRNQAIA